MKKLVLFLKSVIVVVIYKMRYGKRSKMNLINSIRGRIYIELFKGTDLKKEIFDESGTIIFKRY